jgi:hypothetical protein
MDKPRKRRIIVNNDFYNIFQVEPPVTQHDVFNAVDKLAGTQVDTLFVMLPGAFGEKGGRALSPEIVRLYEHPETDPSIRNLEAFFATGKDPYQMLVERAREKGIEIFGSLRMNDTHYLDQPFNPWVPQFYYDNLQHRIGPIEGRRVTEFDYRQTVIRDHMLGKVRDALTRYDLDGIELDFTRNCKFFPPDHPEECAPIMTAFIQEVRAILHQAGRERRRRIWLCITLPYSLYGSRREGLDVPTWARLGLVDMVVLSSPFLAEFDRDVADTKRKLPGVQVYAGCDRYFEYPGRVVPKETYRAMALNYLRQGADGIYLYNVMAWTMDLARMPAMVRRFGGQGFEASDICLTNEVGEIDALEFLDKLYLVSHGEASGDHCGASLPITIPARGEATVRLSIGDDLARLHDRIETIQLQTVSSDCSDYANYTVKLNGTDLSRQYAFVPFANKPESALLFPEPGRTGALPSLEKVRRHSVRPVDLHMGVNVITIQSYCDPLTITDIELAIRYKQRAC